MGRLRKSVNYGTNGGVAITSKASDFDPTQAGVQAYASGGPTACNSTAYSVTETQYDWLGRPVLATDNAGRVTKTVYDAAGRTARVIANYVAWEGETDTNLPPQRSGDINVITEYGYYDSDGRLWTQTAADPDGDGSVADNQVTTYAYVSPGTCPSAAGEDLLSSVTYPDGGVVGYTYYADGSMATMTDQNGTVHTYTRDRLGRVTADIVTLATGSAVDNSVLRTTTSYDNQGRVSQVDTYATTSGGAPTSEVAYDYAPSGGVKTSWQSHSGAADTTSTSTTPRVQYFYGRSADGSTVRLTRIVYPNGRVVQFNYGLAGSDPDGPFGRFGSISDPAGNVYASYTYMGVDSAIRVDHPGVSGDLVLNYDPLGNHSCSGLDSLGRIVQQSWTIDGTQVDGYAYGYDGSGNRTYKQNLTATGLDELYSYDSLGRLTNASRGTLNEGHTAITSASLEQGWTLDGVGNWSNYTSDDGTTSVDQDRDVTEANEISSITTNNSTAAWLTPTYDADGNMISAPKARAESDASQRQLYIYDAWNRLVKLAVDDNGNSTTETTDANGVYDAGSDLVIAQYFYDGLGRRIAKSVAVYGTGSNSSTISNWRRTDYYYDESWQVLEERTALVAANSPTAVVTLSTSGVTVTQYVWDALYVDTPIVRDMDVNGDGDCIDTGDQHLCYLTDANHNVTGLVSLSGHVVERYCYSSYGALAISTARPTWPATRQPIGPPAPAPPPRSAPPATPSFTPAWPWTAKVACT